MVIITKPIINSIKKRNFLNVHEMVITANKRVRNDLKVVQNRQSSNKYYAMQFVVK